MKRHKHQIALTFAVLFGGLHAGWSALVLTGIAQPLFDFIMWAHMINMPIVIGPFDTTAAVTLIVVTTAIGYGLGYLGAIVWARVRA